MSDDERKLSELYGILEDMEDSLPDEEMRSKELIDNLEELNLKTLSVPSDEKEEQLAETPESIVCTLTTLKKALELISPQANGGDAGQFESMKRYIEEFLSLFNALNTENDLNVRAKLTAGIKEANQHINAFLGKRS